MKSAPMLEATQIGPAVRALLPEIAERGGEFDRERRIPIDMVEKLRAAGAFRIAAPAIVGGAEFGLLEQLALLEDLAAADGSVAWTIGIAADCAIALTRLGLDTLREIYAEAPDIVVAGATAPTGTADVVDGGYSVSGRWAWGSGSLHADWLFGACVIRDKGETKPGHFPGSFASQCMLMPRNEVEILDTWHVGGLKGTGSNDLAVKDRFVSATRAFDHMGGDPCVSNPIYRSFGGPSSLRFAAMAIGMARGALGDVKAMALAQARRRMAARTLDKTPLFQHRLGESELALHALRSGVLERAREYMSGAEQLPLGPAKIMHPLVKSCTATGAYVSHHAARIVDAAYTAGGGSALFDRSPLQRRLRDVHALTQHVAVSENWIGNYGAALLGHEVGI